MSAMRAGLGSMASPIEITPEAGMSNAGSKYWQASWKTMKRKSRTGASMVFTSAERVVSSSRAAAAIAA
jgi:hypothetical protein